MPRHRTTAAKAPPRLMIEVTEKQFNTFKERLPYGFQKQVFTAIIEDMVRMWDEFGDDFTRAIISKNLTYKQFVVDFVERNYGDSREPKNPPFSRNVLGRTDRIYQEHKDAEENEERE
jgi:hypothetical protein